MTFCFMVVQLLCQIKEYKILKTKSTTFTQYILQSWGWNAAIFIENSSELRYSTRQWSTQWDVPFSITFVYVLTNKDILLMWILSVWASPRLVQFPTDECRHPFGRIYFTSSVSITQEWKTYLCVHQFISFFILHLSESAPFHSPG